MRKIVQIACGSDGKLNDMGVFIGGFTVALCDDGSAWLLLHDDMRQEWKRLRDIPQEAPHED